MENNRGSFSSNLGFVLAAMGSAIGLGNLWGFPYKMGANGGFPFLIIYLAFVIFCGVVVMGVEMVGEKIRDIQGFPPVLAGEIKHCILAHHGEYEYGSPKKPAIMEAVALNFADNTDAKMQTFKEVLQNTDQTDWLGFNRLFESNIRMTRME